MLYSNLRARPYFPLETINRYTKAMGGMHERTKFLLATLLCALSSSAVAFQSSIGPVSSRSQSNQILAEKRPAFLRSNPFSLSASAQDIAGATVGDATLDWSFLDGVYLITCPNADPNGERLSRAKAILDDVGLLDKVQVKEFDTDDENRIRGCYTSHISVLSDVLESTQKNKAGKNPFQELFGSFMPAGNNDGTDNTYGRDVNVLVLEDNLALSSGQLKQSLLDSVAKYTTTDPDWDMIHLSYIPYVPDLRLSRTDMRDIVKLSSGVGSALGTTAYVINSQAIQRLIQDDKENGGFYLPIPDVMAKLFPETRYATNPTIFVRAPNTKSLVNPQLDDLRELLFQPSVALFAQQLLIATGLTTNLLLPIIVLLLLGFSGASLVSTFESMYSLITTGDFGGPVAIPILSAAFSLFSLAVLAKGAMLAPKQETTS